MILSNVEIIKALDAKRVIIDPEPTPRDGLNSPFKSSAVDLRLGNEIASYIEGSPIHIDLSRGSFSEFFARNSVRKIITDENPHSLLPGKFVLANTYEKVVFPIHKKKNPPCLAARIEGRSSYARCGLLVHATAPTIHAGFDGYITLELKNLGELPIILKPKVFICQLIIEEVAGKPVMHSESQFQHQVHPGGEKK